MEKRVMEGFVNAVMWYPPWSRMLCWMGWFPQTGSLSRIMHPRGCHPSARSPGSGRNTAQWRPISEDDHPQP